VGPGGAHATGEWWLGARARAEAWAAIRPGCLRSRARFLRGVEDRRVPCWDRRRDRARRRGLSLGAPPGTLWTVSRHWPGYCARPGRGGADVCSHSLVLRPLAD